MNKDTLAKSEETFITGMGKKAPTQVKKLSLVLLNSFVYVVVVCPTRVSMSPLQQLKRALVCILLELAGLYSLDLNLNRDSADVDVKRGLRRVIVRVRHSDLDVVRAQHHPTFSSCRTHFG